MSWLLAGPVQAARRGGAGRPAGPVQAPQRGPACCGPVPSCGVCYRDLGRLRPCSVSARQGLTGVNPPLQTDASSHTSLTKLPPQRDLGPFEALLCVFLSRVIDESVQSDGLTPPRAHIDEGRRRRSHRKQTEEEEEVKTDFDLTRFTAFTVLDCHLLGGGGGEVQREVKEEEEEEVQREGRRREGWNRAHTSGS
ncbi:hypothetical protein INR49_019435 [Caranx melampygus]|nr:hypothetical protein INR49_019435 [Caranx melampygus]